MFIVYRIAVHQASWTCTLSRSDLGPSSHLAPAVYRTSRATPVAAPHRARAACASSLLLQLLRDSLDMYLCLTHSGTESGSSDVIAETPGTGAERVFSRHTPVVHKRSGFTLHRL